MSGLLGLDYAGGRPGGAAIKAAGYAFCVRYLTAGGTGLPGKLLTAAEYADLRAHGIAVAVNWETTADRMKGGYPAGVTDAQKAVTQLVAIGYPSDRPVYFSADWDASPADQAEIDDYLRGATSIIGRDRIGVYGSYYVCKRCLDNGTAAWAWQTAAWSGGQREPRAHLYQRIGTVTVGGIPCDVNEACQLPDFGQHPVPDTREDTVLEPLFMQGQDNLRFACPVGRASQIVSQAWLSIIVNGPRTAADKAAWKPGHFDIYFQSDSAGISELHWDIDFNIPAGRSSRQWAVIPDGTTQINIEHNVIGRATATLELQPK